jgi:hypothetical protein
MEFTHAERTGDPRLNVLEPLVESGLTGARMVMATIIVLDAFSYMEAASRAYGNASNPVKEWAVVKTDHIRKLVSKMKVEFNELRVGQDLTDRVIKRFEETILKEHGVIRGAF